MLKNLFSNSKHAEGHLSKECLLMLVDGELPSKESTRAREHLETCWTCRGDLEKVEKTISQFIEFRNRIQIPLSPPPPRKWDRFNTALATIAEEINTPKRPWFRLSDLSPFQMRMGIASVSILVIFALILQILVVQPVSATELLKKAEAEQNARLASSSEPVVYQKLRARSGESKDVFWEVWHDAERSRIKQSVSDNNKERVDTLGELSAILSRNQMDAQRPLAPNLFRAWHESLTSKTDVISESGSIELRTFNQGPLQDGEISEAVLKLRGADYHPYEQTINVQSSSGTRTFTITEVDFEVVSRSTLRPGFFDDKLDKPEIASNRETNLNTALQTPEISDTAEPYEKPAETSPTATADLEVEVLGLLNDARADLGDEITVKREQGLLFVRGLVETSSRKAEILKALDSVSANPAVRIELSTVAEAVTKQKNRAADKPSSVETLETNTLDSAAESELVQRFGSETEARRFASRVVGRSGQAMSHVYALRRLSKQFTPAELRTLSPNARSKWLSLIRSHANAFKSDSQAISKDLGEAFSGSANGSSANVAVDSFDDIPRAVESLFAAASTNDRLIRSALTISAGGTKVSTLKSAQFWRSLRDAEALSARIAAVR